MQCYQSTEYNMYYVINNTIWCQPDTHIHIYRYIVHLLNLIVSHSHIQLEQQSGKDYL